LGLLRFEFVFGDEVHETYVPTTRCRFCYISKKKKKIKQPTLTKHIFSKCYLLYLVPEAQSHSGITMTSWMDEM
jgi:hypothetical protein